MATDEQALLQENIEEYVNDDNKIVTCKWLSLTHTININVAKRALHLFVDNQRNKKNNDELNVTYFIAGLGKSKDGNLMHKCAVVTETELEAVKKSLSVVTSCHIFSVQRSKLKDYLPLYMTDYEVVKNNISSSNSFSVIECPWATLRASGTSAAQTKAAAAVKPEQKENTPLSTHAARDKPPNVKPSDKKSPAKGSIASMFACAGKKDEAANKAAKPAQKTDVASKTKGTEKKGGMMAFMNKKAEPAPKRNEPAQGDASSKKTETAKSKDRKATTKANTDGKRKKKQAADSDDDEPGVKRRRRIRTDLFDSSDDEEGNEEEHAEEGENIEEDESPINISPEDEVESKVDDKEEAVQVRPVVDSSTNAATGGKRRKRTKKVVTKHYQDEDGFMVTKKETVWESETDDEQEEEPVKTTSTKAAAPASGPVKQQAKAAASKAEPKGKGVSKKASASPQKSKQTSLMSFFKKK